MENEGRVVVVDNGSHSIKAGLAGEDHDSVREFTSNVGRQTKPHEKIHVGHMTQDLKFTRLGKVNKPIKKGIITSWDDMEVIWKHTFSNELHIDPEEHPVLLTESPLNPRMNREKMTMTMFETFRTPAIYAAMSAVLSIYSCGLTTGICIDAGYGASHTVPVYEGYALPYAIKKLDIAGRGLTEYLANILRERGYHFRISEYERCLNSMKEKLAYCAQDFWAELAAEDTKIPFELPDGQKINIGAELFRCPEPLFNPTLVGQRKGIHQLAHQSIQQCSHSIRKDMYSNIVPSGGSTMFMNFDKRLYKEIKAISPKKRNIKIVTPPREQGTTVAPPPRRHLTWVGGSILGSLTLFKELCISMDDYYEHGPRIVHRKCF